MSDEFDPYHVWLGIPPSQQPPTHYRLLGIEPFESNADVIDAAASRQTAYLHQLAAGPNRKASQSILNEIAAARRCLLNPDSKAAYDEKLKAEDSVQHSASDHSAAQPNDSGTAAESAAKTAPASTGGKEGADTRIVRCSQCNVRLQATQATLKRGLKCPKCGSQVRLRKKDAPPTIRIDTSDESPTRAIKERKPVPWWAHPMSIAGAGTVLLLSLAAIAKWMASPNDPPPDPPAKNVTVNDDEPEAQGEVDADADEPGDESDFFIVDFKQATTKGKWATANAPAGFVGSGHVISNDPKASIRFEFKPPVSAPYEIRLKYVTNSRYGNAVPVKLQIRNAPETSKLNMKQAPQGHPGYRFLGVRFLKANDPVFVELKVAGAGGHVYAESVEFIRRRGTDIGICGYWPMESVSERHPAEIGESSAVLQGGRNVPGAIGKAIQFKSADQMRLGADMLHPSQGSLSFWLRQDSGKPAVILSTASKDAKDGIFKIQTIESGKDLKLAVQLSTSPQSPGIPIDQTIVPGEWYHIVLTWNEGDTAQVYCNGRQLGQRKKTPKLSRVPIRFLPGAADKPDQSVTIDEIRVYRQRNLAEADAATLFELAKKK